MGGTIWCCKGGYVSNTMAKKDENFSPVIMYVDNVGAIFLTSNVTTTSLLKHGDIRYK